MTKKEYDNLYKEYSQDSYKVGKYQRAGIYCIQINDVVVYVGKSIDMLSRVVGHVLEIKEGINGNKYKVLHEAS